MPAPVTSPTSARVADLLARMSPEEKIGQLIFHLVYGASADQADDRNTALFGVATPAEVVAKYRLGGVIYFAWAGNTENPQQIGRLSNGLQAAAGIPLIVGTDQEGGRVARMGPPATQFPGAMALGAAHAPELTREAYAVIGRELRAVGITADFAPVADVNSRPANPVIGIRSFGSEPDVVGDHVRAAIAGLQLDGGLCAAAKHFPGHGDTGTDSHHALPVITHSLLDWETVDAVPFRDAVRAAADMIMTGHLAFPELDPSGDPATLSRPILTGLLRDHLGYRGVIITDSLRMQAVRELYDDGEIAVRALQAGVDVLLEPADPDRAVAAIRTALDDGRLSWQRIEESVARILELKQRRGLFEAAPTDPQTIDRVVGCRRHLDRAREITAASITLIRDDEQLVPLIRRPVCLLGADADPTARLESRFAATGLQVSSLVTGLQPDRDMIDRARHLAYRNGQTVIVTSGGYRSRGQRALVRAVRAVAERVSLVAIAEPYDAGLVVGGGTMLLTYSATPVALEAVADVLLGRQRPTGRLPVAVGENPDHPLFPFGAGTN